MIDASTMLGTLMESFPGFETFLNLFVSLVGLILTGMAVFKFIDVDHGRGRLITPFMYLLAGAALWNFAASINTFLETMYGSSTSVQSLLSYSGSNLSDQTAKMSKMLIMCIRLIGYVAYVRGWLIFKRIGDGNHGSDEAFSKAAIHLFAGVAAINIVETVNVISSSVGFGNVLS